MRCAPRSSLVTPLCAVLAVIVFASGEAGLQSHGYDRREPGPEAGVVLVHRPTHYDVSRPLASMGDTNESTPVADCEGAACGTSPSAPSGDQDAPQTGRQEEPIPPPTPPPTLSPAGIAVEQTSQGTRPAVPLLESFDGLGAGFEGPQGTTNFRNPSDNSLAVGPDHIVQIVNSRIAIYSKKAKKYDKSGTVLYGAVTTKSVWTGFGGACEARNNGDAVVRYDQLAGRWLIVMPIFSRIGPANFQAKPVRLAAKPVPPGQLAKTGEASSPGRRRGASRESAAAAASAGARSKTTRKERGSVGHVLCGQHRAGPARYLLSLCVRADACFRTTRGPRFGPMATTSPTSTGDDVIQKHACIADRTKMLVGQPATEQCIVIDGVNFLNNADIDGRKLPPAGAPNIMMAAGGTQLKKIFDDDGIYFWKVHVDWNNPANTKADGPVKINVAPYHYLCNGQLSSCVPQPNTERRLDVQGDKIMQRLVYRKVGETRVDRRRALGRYRRAAAGACAGTSSASTKRAIQRCISRARMRRKGSTVGCPASRWTRKVTSASDTRSVGYRISRGSASRRGRPAIQRAS